MGRSWARQLELNLAFKEWCEKHCNSCANKMYCLITNTGASDKAVCIYKGKKSDKLIVACGNFKPRYIGNLLDV